MVIAVFQGADKNSAGLKAIAIIETPKQLTLRFQVKWFQTGKGVDYTTPYGFFVVRRPAKQVALEQNVQTYDNSPPEWKEVHRFPPGKAFE